MTTTIVVAGKGGVGKTAISALLIELLSKKGVVLAIDADNVNLEVLFLLPVGAIDNPPAVGRNERSSVVAIFVGNLSHVAAVTPHDKQCSGPRFIGLCRRRPEGWRQSQDGQQHQSD